MRREALTIWLLLACLASTLTAVSANAMNVDGKFGIGFEETLTSVGVRQSRDLAGTATALPDMDASGLAARWYLGNLGLEAIVGAGLHRPRQPATGSADTEYTMLLSAGAFYNVYRAPSVNLAIGGRLLNGWSRRNDQSGQATAWRYGLALELPLRVEYFFSPAFAIGAAVGPVLTWNFAAGNPLTGVANSFDISLTRGDFSGGLGFTYYFN